MSQDSVSGKFVARNGCSFQKRIVSQAIPAGAKFATVYFQYKSNIQAETFFVDSIKVDQINNSNPGCYSPATGGSALGDVHFVTVCCSS